MGPYKLSSVRKQLRKLDLNRKGSTYSLRPFLSNWMKNHPPELSYSSKPSNKSFNAWKEQVHDLLSAKIKVLEPLPLKEQKIEYYGEVEADNIKFIKFSLMALPNLRVPAILCVPLNLTEKAPAIVCIHGHNQSIQNSIGLKRSKNKEYFGYELAKLGVITLSFDWIGSGEREKFINRQFLFFQDEGERSNWVRFLGLDMLGLRITEAKGLLNYLETRKEIDPNRFGIVGHSGGGTLSLFTTILEDRIKVCAVSGYFGTWEHSILAMYHCGCNYSADLRKYIELYDVFASLAPKPVAITIGRKDRIFPIEGVEKAIPIIQKAYEEANSAENLLIDVQSQGHRFYGEKVYPFLLNHI